MVFAVNLVNTLLVLVDCYILFVDTILSNNNEHQNVPRYVLDQGRYTWDTKLAFGKLLCVNVHCSCLQIEFICEILSIKKLLFLIYYLWYVMMSALPAPALLPLTLLL